MNYHNITKDDMLNGSGLRVCLWVSGCNHYCKNCQNPQTWDSNSGIEFDECAKEELFNELDKNYISGITFTGGDPLYEKNRNIIYTLCKTIKNKYGATKTIWVYTGYTYEECLHLIDIRNIIDYVDVLVDGKYVEEKKDINYPFAGSTNQRIIDVQESLKQGRVIEYKFN